MNVDAHLSDIEVQEFSEGESGKSESEESKSDNESRGWGGDSHMKQTGMLVVSLRGVNFEFWSRLGCSGQNANILSRQGLV